MCTWTCGCACVYDVCTWTCGYTCVYDVCVCAHGHVGVYCVWQMHVCTWTYWQVCSVLFSWPRAPKDLGLHLLFHLSSTVTVHVLQCELLHGFWGFELRSSGFHRKHLPTKTSSHPFRLNIFKSTTKTVHKNRLPNLCGLRNVHNVYSLK